MSTILHYSKKSIILNIFLCLGLFIQNVSSQCTLTVKDTSICMGSCATLNVSGASTYMWSPTTSLNTTTGSSVLACPNYITVYTVTGTDLNSNTCTATVRVIVNTLPSISMSSNTHSVCKGEVCTLVVAGGSTYKWNNGSTSSVINVSPEVTTTYTVTGSDINGCKATTSTVLTVNPNATIVITPKDPIICPKTSVTMTATGGVYYKWNYGINTSVITVSPISSTTYVVTGTDVNGCKGTDTSVVSVDPNCYGTDKFKVEMLVDGKLMSFDKASILCNDSCYDFTLKITGGTPPYTYDWFTIWQLFSTTESLRFCTKDFDFVNNDSIYVTVTDADKFTVKTIRPFSFHPPVTQQICIVSVDSVTKKNMIIWEQSTDTLVTGYNIYKETSVTDEFDLIGFVPLGKISVFIDTTSDPEKVSARYKMKAVAYCAESNESSQHKTVHLTINPGINNNWNLIWENYEGINGVKNRIWRGSTSNGLQLIDSVSSSVTTYTDLHPPQGIIYYAIEMVPPFKCHPSEKSGKSDYSSSFSNIINNKAFIGINEVQYLPIISIYPNPADELLNVDLEGKNGKVEIGITDISGRVIYRTSQSQNSKISINTQGFSRGIYLINIESEEYLRTEKFVIAR